MEFSFSLKLSGNVFQIKCTGDDIKETILKLTPFLEYQDECGMCKKSLCTTLRARSVKDGEFIYLEFVCTKCGARRPFGEYKKPKGAMFLKKWEAKYQSDEDGQ